MIDVSTLIQVAEQQRDLLLVKRGSLQQDLEQFSRMQIEAYTTLEQRYKQDVSALGDMFNELIAMKIREVEELNQALGGSDVQS